MIGSGFAFKYKTSGPPIKLSLVALMDIFTILVFFLLMNSGESQKIENAKFVKLPDSASTAAPHADLKIYIDAENVWLDDDIVASVGDIVKTPKKIVPTLAEALVDHIEKRGKLNSYEESHGLGVTIMADKSVPYLILKSVMATCAGQNFRDISLAVNQIAAAVFPGQVQSEIESNDVSELDSLSETVEEK